MSTTGAEIGKVPEIANFFETELPDLGDFGANKLRYKLNIRLVLEARLERTIRKRGHW